MSATGAPLLRIEGVAKTFPGRPAVEALAPIDLSVAENEFVSIVGTSGCGKSTLLGIVAGLVEPSAGRVLVDGRPIAGPGPDRGVVFQQYTLLPWLTARRNIEFALRGERMSAAERRRVADEHLELVGLGAFADALPRNLSGGMKQRVAIARALCYRPRILLMDEPFGALDEMTRERLNAEVLRVWGQTGTTVIFVTHSIPEAVFLSTRVVVMSARPGRISTVIPIDLPQPRSEETRETDRYYELVTQVCEALRANHGPAAGAVASVDRARAEGGIG